MKKMLQSPVAILLALLCALTLLPAPAARADNINDHWGYHVTGFSYDGYNYAVNGHFYNDNAGYTLKRLSNFKISLYDANRNLMMTLNAHEGSLYDVVLAPNGEWDYAFTGTASGLDLSRFDTTSIGTAISCDYQYIAGTAPAAPSPAQPAITAPSPTVPSITDQSWFQPRPKTMCRNCLGRGGYTCKACGGEGYLYQPHTSIISNKCRACDYGWTTCWECGGEGYK